MIKCPKCGSEHVSIITEIKTEKREESILSFIQAIATIVCFTSIIYFIIFASISSDAISYLIEGKANIAAALNISSSLIDEIYHLYNIWKTTKISFLIILGTIISRLFLPQDINSSTKCICHECEHNWEHENNDKNPS